MSREAEQEIEPLLRKRGRHIGNLQYGESPSCGNFPRNRIITTEPDPTPAYPPAETAERVETLLRMAEMERRIRKLERKHESLLAFIAGHPAVQHRGTLVDPKISSVVQITDELFNGSKIEIELEHEPDDPGDEPFVVFRVECRGDLKEMSAKEKEWNRRVHEAKSGHSGQLRLLVCPVE